MNKKVLVVGDIMLDEYHFGRVERISPEAPVPVFLETNERRFVAGGAANVAVNISAIGVDVTLFGIIGNDYSGDKIIELIYITKIENRKTTLKLRYIGQGNQQILRVDDECVEDVKLNDIKKELTMIGGIIKDFDIIVLSDYKKGFLSQEIIQYIIKLAKDEKKTVIVDVKEKNYKKYANATILKPNKIELELMIGKSLSNDEEIVEAARTICHYTPCEYVLTTLGAEGMLLANKNGLMKKVQSVASEVFDVTGAGDTSLAYLAAELANGKELIEAMIVANYASGVQVSKFGTSVVYPYEVYRMLSDAKSDHSPLYDKDKQIYEIQSCKRNGKKIVFTNGCFDVLHIGHIQCLKEAKRNGDILVVGINDDQSVRRLKGDKRPINVLEDRVSMLKSLSCVDFVIPFKEDTPEKLIKLIKPDVLVKGGDYCVDTIVGAEFVLGLGGVVKTVPIVEGKSTTNIIKKVLDE